MRRIPVDGLTLDEAIEYADNLLAAYPGAAPRRAKRAFAELMEWFDGHPLGMRVVLPFLDNTDPEVLLAGLRGTVALPGRDVLAASVGYSVNHLTPNVRHLLVVVSLFQGVVAAAVLGIFSQVPDFPLSQVPDLPQRFYGHTWEDWAQVLEQAAGVGLLSRMGGGMYAIHPALPAYLADQWRLDEPDDYDQQRAAAEAALLEAHAALGHWLFQQISTGDAAYGFAIIERQCHTLGSMLGYALDHGSWDQALGIAQPLNEYWRARGLDEEVQGWIDRALLALEAADGTPPALDTSAGALWLFFAHCQAIRQFDARDLDAAERTYVQIREMLQEQTKSHQADTRLAGTFYELGVIAQYRGHPDNAEDWYRKSLTIYEQLGDRLHIASVYHRLGTVALDRGHLDDAEDWYRKSLSISEELGDRVGTADGYQGLGTIARERGHLGDAEDWYRKSLAISEELGDRPRMAQGYHGLGAVTRERGRLDDAEDWYRKSLSISEELGDRPGMASDYRDLGTVARERGHLDDAEDWYRKSLSISEELGDHQGMAATFGDMGTVALHLGRPDDAEHWYRESLTTFAELGDRAAMAGGQHGLGMVAQELGRLDEAEDWYRQSLASIEEFGDQPGMAAIFGQMGLLAEARGRPEEAMEWTVRCVAVFDEFPHPFSGPGPMHLARLAAELGIDALERCWDQVTREPVPQRVRDFISSWAGRHLNER
jgi:tetratricopeptide (TPR) repeat protein